MPLFSIIIPVYNNEQYLEDCINSILYQSFSDWELILIDDGSTDSSSYICDKYCKQHTNIKVLHKTNEGVSIARKYGCNLSKGKYIIFVDSDDVIDSLFLETVNNAISEKKAEIYVLGIKQQLKNGKIKFERSIYKGFYNKKKIISEIYPILIHNIKCQYFPPTLCGKVFLKDIISPYLIIDSRAKIGEDGASLIPAVFYTNSIYFINRYLYFYRYNKNSATKSHKQFDWCNPQAIYDHIKAHIDLELYDFKNQIYRKLVHDIFNVCVTQFYSKEKYNNTVNNCYYNLQYPLYYEAINKAFFSGNIKASLMHLALKKHLFFLIYLYSLLK